MSRYLSYHHIERYGEPKVEGANLGICYVFPKIDGTYGSIYNENNELRLCNKERYITLENDNQKFAEFIFYDKERYLKFFEKYPNLKLHGEFLTPHTLTTYEDSAWNKFYVFDVEENGEYLNYEIYKDFLIEFDILFIPPICKLLKPSLKELIDLFKHNTYLIKDGCGTGEGLVVKNYDWRNRSSKKQRWMKVVRNEFKNNLIKKECHTFHMSETIEKFIVRKYVTGPFVEKEWMKIVNNNPNIPHRRLIEILLNKVFYELVNEEIWNIIKKNKYPTVDFKQLMLLCQDKVKEIKWELFSPSVKTLP